MKILALNCGSSSLKCALIESESKERLLEIRVEGIGGAAHLVDRAARRHLGVATIEDSLDAVLAALLDGVSGRPPQALVHRVVHGGDTFRSATLLTREVVAALEPLNVLAPLHNPPAIAVIRRTMTVFADLPQVAVFDTAFHTTLPARAREYALPEALRGRLGIRRFGFHGISHAHVASTVAKHLRTRPDELRVVSCHLGNGASVAAIEYGRSVETSMGMTPLEGLVMGTRAGDLDPGIVLALMRSMDPDALAALLNRDSGLTGLAGTNDLRAIEQAASEGDERARLALGVYSHRVRKYIGAYVAVMGGTDVIAFTGGIGENSAAVRHRCVQRLDFLGAIIDEDRNRDVQLSDATPVVSISAENSRTRLFVIRADEESSMVEAAATILRGSRDANSAPRVPVAVSARHAHLTTQTLAKLFGDGYELKQHRNLSQHGQFAAEETVALIGPRGRIDRVRVMGPPRTKDQVEISRSDEFVLGIDAPVRISGDLANSPGITLEGPNGRVTIASGVIASRRHIHMSPRDASRLNVADRDVVAVRIDSDGRDTIFDDVMVRIGPDFELELHLDTDEANAAAVTPGTYAELLPPSQTRLRTSDRSSL